MHCGDKIGHTLVSLKVLAVGLEELPAQVVVSLLVISSITSERRLRLANNFLIKLCCFLIAAKYSSCFIIPYSSIVGS